MKHEAMKVYETQGSSLEGSKEGRTPKCPRADKAVTGSNIQKRKGHQNVQQKLTNKVPWDWSVSERKHPGMHQEQEEVIWSKPSI
jgi:hypothetical protein